MKDDDISRVARGDETIMAVGHYWFQGFSAGKSGKQVVTTKMRELARLVLELRVLSGKVNLRLAELLKPSNFDTIVHGTRRVSGFKPKSHPDAPEADTFAIPSLAIKIGQGLKTAARVAAVRAMKSGHDTAAKQFRSYLEVHDLEWTSQVSSIALNVLREHKSMEAIALPLTSDLQRLNQHIRSELAAVKRQDLQDVAEWKKVAELVATRLLILNKRRQTEPFRLLIVEWQRGKERLHEDATVDLALSDLEKKVASSMLLFKVRGKRAGSLVPLLVPKEFEHIIDWLIYERKCDDRNPYVFARTKGLGYLSPFEARNNVVSNCTGIQHPERLGSIKLRKYVATCSQILALEENELTWLTRHMGHSLQVHHTFYRIHEDAIELSKMGKLLLAIDAGNIANLRGKRLDEIQFDDLNIEDDEGNEDDIEE